MAIQNVMAGIAVRELEAGLAWYARFFGRPYDSRPMKEVGEWKFPLGGWAQVFADPRRVGSSSMTVVVKILDEEIARLRSADIAVGPTTKSDYVHVAEVSDPDGNRLILAQPMKTPAALDG